MTKTHPPTRAYFLRPAGSQCFSTSKALKSFIELELGGRRVRLSEPPADEHAELAEGLGLRASDALTNALRLRSRYGWDVLGGFILFERVGGRLVCRHAALLERERARPVDRSHAATAQGARPRRVGAYGRAFTGAAGGEPVGGVKVG